MNGNSGPDTRPVQSPWDEPITALVRRTASSRIDPPRPGLGSASQPVILAVLLILALPLVLLAEARAPFSTWLADLRADAVQRGVSVPTLEVVLADAAPLDRVLELQTRQPEAILSWTKYERRVVSEERVLEGRRLLEEYGDLLAGISARYGVQPRFLVALWGIESDFGHRPGELPAVSALATLAWAGHRGDYFRRELLELLLAVEAGQARPEDLRGSWAGALGQCQFMPSNFRRFAVDYDGDGWRDIWNAPADVLASMANFLRHLGWRDDETWGRPVHLPAGFDARLAGRNAQMLLGKWNRLGVRRLNGADLPRRRLWASLLLPDGVTGDAFLVYGDFGALLRWNRSHHFALAVGQLSNRLR